MTRLTAKQAEEKFLAYCETLGVEVEVDYVGAQSNVPGVDFDGEAPDWLTMHETANENALADARMHRDFVANGGGDDRVSFTASVDWQRIVLILPLNWANNNAVRRAANYDGMSIETCVNVPVGTIKWSKTKDNAAKCAAAMLAVWGMGMGSVVQHFAWTQKNCPTRLRRAGWEELRLQIDAYRRRLLAPEPEGPLYFPETGHYVGGGFKELWLRHGLKVCGYPRGEEYQEVEPKLGGITVTRQRFENTQMLWYPGIEARFEALGTMYDELADECAA